MEMLRDVSFLLLDFFFEGLFLLSRETAGSLSQTFLQLWALTDINEDSIAFFEESKFESSKPNLNNSSVIVDLNTNRLFANN